jgi:stage II sporulation protein E
VFRDGSLFKLGSRTFPIGIIKDPDVGSINMELLPGDVIVMVSDGVTGGREECPELFEMLRSRIATHSSEQLAEAVIRYAEDTDSPDDISVIVIKVQEKVFEK